MANNLPAPLDDDEVASVAVAMRTEEEDDDEGDGDEWDGVADYKKYETMAIGQVDVARRGPLIVCVPFCSIIN